MDCSYFLQVRLVGGVRNIGMESFTHRIRCELAHCRALQPRDRVNPRDVVRPQAALDRPTGHHRASHRGSDALSLRQVAGDSFQRSPLRRLFQPRRPNASADTVTGRQLLCDQVLLHCHDHDTFVFRIGLNAIDGIRCHLANECVGGFSGMPVTLLFESFFFAPLPDRRGSRSGILASRPNY